MDSYFVRPLMGVFFPASEDNELATLPLFILENRYGKSFINYTVQDIRDNQTVPDTGMIEKPVDGLSELARLKFLQLNCLAFSDGKNASVMSQAMLHEVRSDGLRTVEDKVADICRSVVGGSRVLIALMEGDSIPGVFKAFGLTPEDPKAPDPAFACEEGIMSAEPFFVVPKEDYLG